MNSLTAPLSGKELGFNPSTTEVKQAGLCETEMNLAYTVSHGSARVTQQDTVSKSKKEGRGGRKEERGGYPRVSEMHMCFWTMHALGHLEFVFLFEFEALNLLTSYNCEIFVSAGRD